MPKQTNVYWHLSNSTAGKPEHPAIPSPHGWGKKITLASQSKTTSTLPRVVYILPFQPTLDPTQLLPIATVLPGGELEATDKDTKKKHMMPPLPCKPSCKSNSMTPSQMTNLQSFGALMKESTKAHFATSSSTFSIDTLSSLTPWLAKTNYTLTNQWRSTNHWPSTLRNKKPGNLLWPMHALPISPKTIVYTDTKHVEMSSWWRPYLVKMKVILDPRIYWSLQHVTNDVCNTLPTWCKCNNWTTTTHTKWACGCT